MEAQMKDNLAYAGRIDHDHQVNDVQKCPVKPKSEFHWDIPEWMLLYVACWVFFVLKVLFIFFCFRQYFRMRRREREGRESEKSKHEEKDRAENRVEEVEEEQDYNEMD